MSVIICLFGPPAAGKTFWKKKLIEKGFQNIKSYTTRKPRNDETDKDYNFVTLDEWEDLIINNKLININKYRGEWYGTPEASVLSFNNSVLITDISSIKNLRKDLKQRNKEFRFVYCKAPSYEEIEERLITRNTPEKIPTAKEEIEIHESEKFSKDIVVFSSDKDVEKLITEIGERDKENWRDLVF